MALSKPYSNNLSFLQSRGGSFSGAAILISNKNLSKIVWQRQPHFISFRLVWACYFRIFFYTKLAGRRIIFFMGDDPDDLRIVGLICIMPHAYFFQLSLVRCLL